MNSGRGLFLLLVLVCLAILSLRSSAQTETATISGRVTDQQGAILVNAQVTVTNVETSLSSSQMTNRQGLYVLSGLKPGRYRLTVRNTGFRTVNLSDIVLNVQDSISQNVKLQVGSISESVTVVADETRVDTESAAVSTVVDRNFAENLPMNGRSFQTLIQLTPGVVLTASNYADSGQFSVNGQRASANYWLVDGVSANIGMSGGTQGNGAAGALGGFSVQGGTNSIVSVDAMQEFRIQTSTYAPEFGRTPGAQISIATRSGTNQLHGTAFEYLRNDVIDANDWFANHQLLRKPEERQNDFGGTLSGPILKSRTFFFFSYEGIRLRLPQVAEATVPSLAARQSAVPGVQPFLNAYPLPSPSAPDNNGVSPFGASYSNRSTLDATSFRLDHRLNEKLNLFGRYNYAPSQGFQRGTGQFLSLSTSGPTRNKIETATVGTTWAPSSTTIADLRFNYSRTSVDSFAQLDDFGGAVVPSLAGVLPNPYTLQNSYFGFNISSLSYGFLQAGNSGHNVQRSFNLVGSVSLQKGTHSLKFGGDFRRLSPVSNPANYRQFVYFGDVPSAQGGSTSFGITAAAQGVTLLFHNLGAFAQDTWRASSRLTVTYGLRWDVDFAPTSTSGPPLPVATNFHDLSRLGLAPDGTSVFRTKYNNFAPRLGVAFQLSDRQGWERVFRGGIGSFYDLATQEVGTAISGNYPFQVSQPVPPTQFPLTPAEAAPPVISPTVLSASGVGLFDPGLRLPYSLEWNVALEQALGTGRSLSTSYIGAAGRRLLQTGLVYSPNPNLGYAYLTTNAGTSDYSALQVQFRQRVSRGLQALCSYTWAHSIDTGSASSAVVSSNVYSPELGANANRGPSDFDIRNAFSAGITYELPAPKLHSFVNAIIRGWSVHNVVLARSAQPVDVYDSNLFSPLLQYDYRPDVIFGAPLYLHGSTYPGGKAFNSNAFAPPPIDPTTGAPLRQGTLTRNSLRGFGAAQWDFAVHREFPIHEQLRLQFRAEMFNVLNHPNFGPPVSDLANTSQFGQSTQMLGRSLNQNQNGGGFDTLYQIGGPRSIQLALKLLF